MSCWDRYDTADYPPPPEQIKPCDAVKLIRGESPLMTVEKVISKSAWCWWFDSLGHLQHHSIPLHLLRKM